MKVYDTIKVGYSAGHYGCSGEQYLVIWTAKDGLKSYSFEGLYGADDRVRDVFEKAGYKRTYIACKGYGRMTRKDAKYFNSEYTAIEELKDQI